MVSRYVAPANSELAKLVEGLPQWAREYFEERAGILEYEANYPRSKAEQLAWGEVQRIMHRLSPELK